MVRFGELGMWSYDDIIFVFGDEFFKQSSLDLGIRSCLSAEFEKN